MTRVRYEDIVKAMENIKQTVRKTALEYSTTFTELAGREVYFKFENLQKTGSFKIRGAYNKIRNLVEAGAKHGVIAASAGNHAQGVAYAAARAGYQATIVMPLGVSIAKLMATKSYGAKVILSGESYDEAYIEAQRLQQEQGTVLIHAFDDPDIIAGQGTIGLELIEDLPDLDTVIIPIGGGGLIAGMAVALKHLNPRIRIVGVQAVGARAMKEAVTGGKIVELPVVSTIADGIAVKHPGALTFDIVRKLVDDIVLVNDEEISEAILMMLERGKVLCEGAAATGVAALLHGRVAGSGKTAVVISGGNIDVHTLSIIIERGLIKAGRYVRVKTVLVDKPGALHKLLTLVAATKSNVISINHERILPRIPVTQAEIQLDLETRDTDHVAEIMHTLADKGYVVDRVQCE